MLIVGAGITGITAAYLLKRAGHTVALVDKDRCSRGDTSYTTAHLTCVTDTPLSELVEELRRRSRAGGVGRAARRHRHHRPHRVARADQMSVRLGAGLSLQSVGRDGPAGRGAQRCRSARKKQRSRRSSASTPSSSTSVPLFNRPGVRYDNQAKFHPRKYLIALLRLLERRQGLPGVREHEDRGDRRHTHHRDHHRRRIASTASTCSSRRTCRCRAKPALLPATAPAVEARAVHVVRRRRLGTARHRSRSAVLGHRRSVRLPARRSPTRPRLRDFRRRRSQDRAGRGHARNCFTRLEQRLKQLLPRHQRSRITGPGR